MNHKVVEAAQNEGVTTAGISSQVRAFCAYALRSLRKSHSLFRKLKSANCLLTVTCTDLFTSAFTIGFAFVFADLRRLGRSTPHIVGRGLAPAFAPTLCERNHVGTTLLCDLSPVCVARPFDFPPVCLVWLVGFSGYYMPCYGGWLSHELRSCWGFRPKP